jgi:hypothetical protein
MLHESLLGRKILSGWRIRSWMLEIEVFWNGVSCHLAPVSIMSC